MQPPPTALAPSTMKRAPVAASIDAATASQGGAAVTVSLACEGTVAARPRALRAHARLPHAPEPARFRRCGREPEASLPGSGPETHRPRLMEKSAAGRSAAAQRD